MICGPQENWIQRNQCKKVSFLAEEKSCPGMLQFLLILEAGRVQRLEVYFSLGIDRPTVLHDPEQALGGSPTTWLNLAQM
jgi:hypothetical protein